MNKLELRMKEFNRTLYLINRSKRRAEKIHRISNNRTIVPDRFCRIIAKGNAIKNIMGELNTLSIRSRTLNKPIDYDNAFIFLLHLETLFRGLNKLFFGVWKK